MGFAINGQYQDMDRTCKDCQTPFLFTAGEQKFYDEKNFKDPPARCKPCREVNKAKRNLRENNSFASVWEGDDDRGNRRR